MSELPLNQVLCGDCREVMKGFPDNSIDLVVTSPPYWGLRDYGPETVQVWGDKPECEHEWGEKIILSGKSGGTKSSTLGEKSGGHAISDKGIVRSIVRSFYDETKSNFCVKCGAWRGSLGLEPHPQMFIDHLVEICREIKRVLKSSGSFWLNLGDTYYGSGGKGGQYAKFMRNKGQPKFYKQGSKHRSNWLQPKQLLGMPWRVVITLQEDGWILRNSVIWHKPNHMPSSVKDRLTPSYEFFFFFVKARKYYFDLDPIRQPYSEATLARITQPNVMNQKGGQKQRELRGEGGGNASRSADMVKSLARKIIVSEDRKELHGPTYRRHQIPIDGGQSLGINLKGKNPGDLWTIPTHPFPAAHFATFPMKLIEPIIRSSCPQQICINCGVSREKIFESKPPEGGYKFERNLGGREDGYSSRLGNTEEIIATYTFLGYSDCGCGAGFKPGIVLDPFCGSGTALRVARKLGRTFIGIDIKKEYCEMSERRVKRDRYQSIPDDIVPLSKIFGEGES